MNNYDIDKVSKRPWEVNSHMPDSDDCDYSYFICDANDETKVVINLGRYPTDNHYHIVECVNDHDRLKKIEKLAGELTLDYVDSYEHCIHCFATDQYPKCTNPECPAIKLRKLLEKS